MQRKLGLLLFTMSAVAPSFFAYGQQVQSPAASNPANQKTLVVATESKSDSVVAVPPVTSVVVSLKPEKKSSADPIDLPRWIAKEDALNGLQSAGLMPWHIVVNYDQYDEDGDNVHSGVYEEFWVGEKKYKRVYKSDNFNQIDYGTDKGLFRQGDQKWPDRAQSQVQSEVIAPFYYAATLQGFHGRNVERTFSGYKLQCVFIERDSGISDPTQYCFEPDSSATRAFRRNNQIINYNRQNLILNGPNLLRVRDLGLSEGHHRMATESNRITTRRLIVPRAKPFSHLWAPSRGIPMCSPRLASTRSLAPIFAFEGNRKRGSCIKEQTSAYLQTGSERLTRSGRKLERQKVLDCITTSAPCPE